MIGFVRNAAVIGMMAYFSPVHDQTPQQRMDALRHAPHDALQSVVSGTPRLALEAVTTMDPQSREALSRKLSELRR